jgi:site-specific recombinase XerD
MEISRAIDRYLEGYFATHERSEKTARAYATDLQQFNRFHGARRGLTTVGPDVVEAWARELKAKGYEPTSVRRKLAALRGLCNYWTRRGALPHSPFWRLRLNLGSGRVLPRILGADEVAAMLRAARSSGTAGRRAAGLSEAFVTRRDVAIVELLFATGIRVGELVGISLDDVTPDHRAIIIRGKGRRQRLAFLLEPQSHEAFGAYLAARTVAQAETRAVFLARTGRPLAAHGVSAVLHRIARLAGIERRVTPHMLRHTVATLLLRNGADLRVVQEFLGHASIVMTQRYTQVSKEQLMRSLEAFHPRASLLR